MSKTVKQLYIESVADRLKGVEDCLVVSLAGLDAPTDYQLRAALRREGIHAFVVQNSLASVALEKAGLAPVAKLFDGPSGLVWGGPSIVELSKVMQKWADQLKPVLIRGGYTHGQTLTPEDVKTLSKIPSRQELLGRVAAQLTASAGRVVALAKGPASRVAGQIKQLSETKSEEPQPAAA